MVSTKITPTYYILSGIGSFTIGDCKFYVSPRYASRSATKHRIFLFRHKEPHSRFETRSFGGNDTHTKWNPNVVRGNFACVSDSGS